MRRISKSEAYSAYSESLSTLLTIPKTLSKSLSDIEHEELSAIEKANANKKDKAETRARQRRTIEQELMSVREKLRVNNIALPISNSIDESEILISCEEAIAQLRSAGMVLLRALRDEKRAEEEAARLHAEEEKRRLEETEKQKNLAEELRKRALQNELLRVAKKNKLRWSLTIGLAITIILSVFAIIIPAIIVFAITLVITALQASSLKKLQ